MRGTHPQPNLRDLIERRVRFALGRFSGRIRRTDVVLADVNGPRGGTDQQCRVTVVLAASPPVVIEVADIDTAAAVSRATERAARHVRDRLARRRDLRRQAGAGDLRPTG
jgi:hypothetical protein